jgi:hypothetical protein
MNPRVTKAVAIDDCRLLLTFTNGESKTFDVAPYLSFPAFRRLADPAIFRSVTVEHGTASWPGGIDFDPDTLFVDGVATAAAGSEQPA